MVRLLFKRGFYSRASYNSKSTHNSQSENNVVRCFRSGKVYFKKLNQHAQKNTFASARWKKKKNPQQ